MASVTYEQAERVVGKVLAELGRPDWLQGVGIEPDPNEGYGVSVRILPGVAVRLRRRRRARALDAP